MRLEPIVPFEPIRSRAIPWGKAWIAQVKWDGVRMLVYYTDGEARLFNRQGRDRTLQYPEFTEVPAYCKASSVILDGEMIALADGKPSFHEIMRRDSLRQEREIRFAVGRIAAIYMVFDVLYYNGKWMNDKTLAERQHLLQQIIIPSDRVQGVPSLTEGERLFAVMKERGWEGIVCKRLDSTYAIGGKDARWQKIKLTHDLYAAVGGVTYRDGMVNAVMLGLYDQEGKFLYIGHAGSGKWKVQDWRDLTEHIQPLIIPARPFHNVPERVKGAVWIQPALTLKVQFLEWTPGGTMRQPIIQGWVNVPLEACRVGQS
ncbi:RNA ligase family protein [Paenibacillus sanguinis]|uniref:ATP-dependent DNA ligase n=1 Tax=Paenibacillus sanguinis TaxID=225906 RepID=UPI0003717AFF|nr:RNA ligase family protein [Paenibacillus sanguinis]